MNARACLTTVPVTQTSQGEISKTCIKWWTLLNTVLYERKFVKMGLTNASLWRPPTYRTVVINVCILHTLTKVNLSRFCP